MNPTWTPNSFAWVPDDTFVTLGSLLLLRYGNLSLGPLSRVLAPDMILWNTIITFHN